MTIPISALRTMPDLVTQLAQRPGGVDVTDESGDVRFRLCVPSEPLTDESDALRAELELYRQVVVPKPDYDRAIAERDRYARAMDGLAAQLADARDSRVAVQFAEAVAHLYAVMRTLAKETGGLEDEKVRNAARAFLAEHGALPAGLLAARQEAEAWLERKGQR